jgi:hypothetical protein
MAASCAAKVFMTPQLRSRLNLTGRGYLVSTVESKKRFPDKKKQPCPVCQHKPMIEISVDLWNCFDLIALKPGTIDEDYEILTVPRMSWLFVQVTTQDHHADRKNKILGSMEAKLVLLSGAKILLQSWKKVDNRFQLREEWITLRDFESAHFYPNTVAELMEIRRKEKLDDLPPGSTLPLSPDLGKEAF